MEWQPIATAPKATYVEALRKNAGVRALVCGPGMPVQLAERVCVFEDGQIGGGVAHLHGSLVDWGFTHWMPLPEPPK